MPLSAEQRAVLDLIVGRGLDHAAIARRTRIPEDDVRARARAALTIIGGADPGEDVAALLLGHAGPDQERAARRLLQRDARARARAEQTVAALQLGWPAYAAPVLPPPRARSGGPGEWLRWGAGGGALVAVVLVLLVVTGVLGGEEEPPAGGATLTETAVPAPVRVALRSPDDGDERGSATLVTTDRFESSLELDVPSLSRPPAGRSYLLWADDGRGRGLPLPIPVEPEEDGPFTQRSALSDALAPLLQQSRRLELLVVDTTRLRTLLRDVEALGRAGSQTLPRRPGAVVLRGELPTRTR